MRHEVPGDKKTITVEHREAMTDLQKLPNVGPATARDLIRLNILSPEDLVNRDPDEMYRTLCQIDGERHDPCVRDVFAAVVDYASGGPAQPWWAFTPQRKAREESKGRAG